jgi:hypothetical protein
LVSSVITQGTRLEIANGRAASALVAPFLKGMSYRAVLTGGNLVPLVYAHRAKAGEKAVVGGYVEVGRGHVYFIPSCSSNERDEFYRALAGLAECGDRTVEDLPPWTSSFRTENEAATLARIESLNTQRQQIDALIAEEGAGLDEEGRLKHLLSGTGRGFLLAAMAALSELGLRVVEGPNSRADLIASGEGRYIAIEAKGIDGAARERQYRQVERWMAELNLALHVEPTEAEEDIEIKQYAECVAAVRLPEYDGSDAKGLLVIGTFRKTALSERCERDFPDTVERLLSRTDTCGMTGVQLFGLVMAIRKDPALRPSILKEIITTRGLLARANDWTTFLTKT